MQHARPSRLSCASRVVTRHTVSHRCCGPPSCATAARPRSILTVALPRRERNSTFLLPLRILERFLWLVVSVTRHRTVAWVICCFCAGFVSRLPARCPSSSTRPWRTCARRCVPPNVYLIPIHQTKISHARAFCVSTDLDHNTAVPQTQNHTTRVVSSCVRYVVGNWIAQWKRDIFVWENKVYQRNASARQGRRANGPRARGTLLLLLFISFFRASAVRTYAHVYMKEGNEVEGLKRFLVLVRLLARAGKGSSTRHLARSSRCRLRPLRGELNSTTDCENADDDGARSTRRRRRRRRRSADDDDSDGGDKCCRC